MTEPNHPIVNITDEDLQQMLQRAMRMTLILGAVAALVVWMGSSWRGGAMLMVGALISAASNCEWQRLVRLINARMNQQKTAASAPVVVLFFMLRLTIFAGVIYGSLKCFQGSVVALLCGLGLAALTVGWEILRLLRD